MEFNHHQLKYEIEDSWLKEASVIGFKPPQKYYLPKTTTDMPKGKIEILRISDFEPAIERSNTKGIFVDNHETAKQRVLRIINWLRENNEIEPVWYTRSRNEGFKYKHKGGGNV